MSAKTKAAKAAVETVVIRTTAHAKLSPVYLLTSKEAKFLMAGADRWFDRRKYKIVRVSGSDKDGVFHVTVNASSHYADLLADYIVKAPRKPRVADTPAD